MKPVSARSSLDLLLTIAMLVLVVLLLIREFRDPPPPPPPPSPPPVVVPVVPVEPVSLEGAHVRGAETAPWTLLMFEDFGCSACRMFETEAMPTLLKDYVDTGRVRLAVHTVSSTRRGETALAETQFATCAAAKGVFWEFREGMFARPAPTVAAARTVLTEVGLEPEDVEGCASGERALDRTAMVREIAVGAGARGTPILPVGSRRASRCPQGRGREGGRGARGCVAASVAR